MLTSWEARRQKILLTAVSGRQLTAIGPFKMLLSMNVCKVT